MIQATPKANSLPEDLRQHWEDQMADKFPMTQDEAMSYIMKRYNVSPWKHDNGTILVNYTEREPITEGVYIPPGWSVEYEYEDNGTTAHTQSMLGDVRNLQTFMNQRKIPKYKIRSTQIVIDDFRASNINEKLSEINE